jgi:hypothetical protein
MIKINRNTMTAYIIPNYILNAYFLKPLFPSSGLAVNYKTGPKACMGQGSELGQLPSCWKSGNISPSFSLPQTVLRHVGTGAVSSATCDCFTFQHWTLYDMNETKTKLHGLSPRANYTDRATAACRRSECQLLRIEGATWSVWRIPTAVFSVF